MLYQDKSHTSYLERIIDQKSPPLAKWIDALYQHARHVPAIINCLPALQQLAALPYVSAEKPQVDITFADIDIALLACVKTLHAYLAVARSPSTLDTATLRPRSAETNGKGRPLYGAGHTKTNSNSSSEYDQLLPTSSIFNSHSCLPR
jgi:hypothetical protein